MCDMAIVLRHYGEGVIVQGRSMSGHHVSQ